MNLLLNSFHLAHYSFIHRLNSYDHIVQQKTPYYIKRLLNCFQLNGHTQGFHTKIKRERTWLIINPSGSCLSRTFQVFACGTIFVRPSVFVHAPSALNFSSLRIKGNRWIGLWVNFVRRALHDFDFNFKSSHFMHRPCHIWYVQLTALYLKLSF